MKILLANYLYKPNIGGVENSLFYISKELIKLGHRPIILVTDLNQFDRNSRLPYFERIDGIEIFRIKTLSNKFPLRSIIGSVFLIVKGIIEIRKLDRRFHFAIAISRDYKLLIGLKFILKKIKIAYILPAIVKKQDSDFSNTKNSIKNLIRHIFVNLQHESLQNFAIKLADKNFVFSQNMYDYVNGLAHKKLVKIPPGIDKNVFKPVEISEKNRLRAILNLNKSDFLVLFLGRFTKVKGLNIAVDAFKKIHNMKIKLLLVGEGPEKIYLQSQIQKNKLENIIIHPQTNNPEYYYQCCDLFLMSSLYESFGQTLLEASLCHLPTLAFSGSEINTATIEILGNNAIYCKNEPFDLGEKIKEIYLNYEESLKIEFKSIEQKYSWTNFTNELLMELIGK